MTEGRDENGVVITTREIYDLLIDLNEKVTIANENIKELYQIRPMYEKRQQHCDYEFDVLHGRVTDNRTEISGMKTQIKTIWGVIMLLLGGLITTAYSYFGGGSSN